MSASDIGIDLGTDSVLVYIRGTGIVLHEPSVVAYDRDTNEIKSIGEEARDMIGRTPGNIAAVRPLRQGVISDYTITEKMLKYFIHKAVGRKTFWRPRITVCVPSGVTEVEKRAVIDATMEAGARDVIIVQEPIAAALGAGIDISKPFGNIVVDIGGGTTEVALVSMGGVVLSHSVRVAGNKIDEAIAGFLKKQHAILVTDRVAEQIKFDLADVRSERKMEHIAVVRGRDIATGMPLTVDVNMAKVSEAIREPIQEILGAIKWVLGRIPPELCADILQNGIFLTGGSAALPNLDTMIATEFGVPVSVARDAGECTTLGAGYMADHFDMLGGISGKAE